MARRKKVYEGKAKVIFEGPEPGTLIQYFKDDASDMFGQAGTIISGKGILNNRICELLMTRLNELGIPTHFLRRLNMREQLIRELEIIPLHVTVRNVAAGDFADRMGLAEGIVLPRSIVEFRLKRPDLDYPLVSEEHITCFDWANAMELDELMALALRINDILYGLFAGVGIRLVDFQTEFGRHYREDGVRIVLADEISADSCRLWDFASNETLDNGGISEDSWEAAAAYQEVARRLGVLPNSGNERAADFGDKEIAEISGE